MKRSALVIVLALSLQPTRFRAQTPESTSAIEGIVREKGTARPVGGAKVTLYAESMPTFQFGALPTSGEGVADAEGRFTVAAKPGRYRVVPSKDGFVFAPPVPLQYPREPGTWVDLTAQQTIRDLQLQVEREAVISGRVIDSKGNAFPGTSGSVSLQIYRYDDYGKRSLAGVPGLSYPGTAWSFTRGNDLGEFRLYGLSPGDYYVSVTGGGSTTFVPGNTDEAHATPIHVESGEEMRLGTIALPPPPLTTKVTLHYVRDGAPFVMGISQVTVLPSRLLLGTSERSEFSFTLAPGTYDVVVSSGLGSTAGDWGRTQVVVGTEEVTQDVEMRPGVRLKGNFSMDEVPLVQPRPLACRLVGSEPFSLAACNNNAVAPGHFSFGLQGMQPDAYVKSATVAGRDILANGIQISSDTEFDIRLGSHGAELRGTATNSKGEAVAHGVVALVPDAPLRGAAPLYKAGPTDINGLFELRGIAPGTYHLFAWTELPGSAYLNAEFMKKYEASGKPVRIEKTEPLVVDVRVADDQASGAR